MEAIYGSKTVVIKGRRKFE